MYICVYIYITADILRQIYYDRCISASDILRHIYTYIHIYICITIEYFGVRYVLADVLRQIYFGIRYVCRHIGRYICRYLQIYLQIYRGRNIGRYSTEYPQYPLATCKWHKPIHVYGGVSLVCVLRV